LYERKKRKTIGEKKGVPPQQEEKRTREAGQNYLRREKKKKKPIRTKWGGKFQDTTRGKENKGRGLPKLENREANMIGPGESRHFPQKGKKDGGVGERKGETTGKKKKKKKRAVKWEKQQLKLTSDEETAKTRPRP